MGNRKKVILCIMILIVIFFAGCKRGGEEGLDSTYKDKERENEETAEIVVESPEERLEEREIPKGTEAEEGSLEGEMEENSLIADPNHWIRFNDSFFQRLIEHRRETKTRLTYDDFHRDIDYQLMMEEDSVLNFFGPPNRREEDPFAYKMYILEYEGLIIYINDYGHGLYATGYYIQSPEYLGPRGTKVGQSVGEVLLAYPLPDRGEYKAVEGQICWGDQTQHYGAYMAAIHHLEDGEITELRFAENTGFAGVAYEISDGVVQSIYFFEMN